ncbi:uncharacterized protein LOC126418737 [Schistocerca serialis cubense]|uniref:uncharacterized protein LOC126418737 n=1 Tax=Schistocerca serialis cubense TaxID=2023355 RepID=UPI00214F5820|nr:uncharacterized protein LOC126418737 [Schistocerca serialis cubense]
MSCYDSNCAQLCCMMRNFTPDAHGKVHLCNHDTMQHGTDGPNNMVNGPFRIGIMFSSPMSVAYAFNQTIVGHMFGGNPVRLNTSDTLCSDCSKVEVPCWFEVALCGADVCHWWSWKAL